MTEDLCSIKHESEFLARDPSLDTKALFDSELLAQMIKAAKWDVARRTKFRFCYFPSST